jgi:hypothetical protein
MHLSLARSRFVALVLGSVLLAVPQTAQEASHAEPMLLGAGFDGAHKRWVPLRTSRPDLSGSLGYDRGRRQLVVQWGRDTADGEPRVSTQSFALGFRPTEVTGYGIDRLCVAGTSESGAVTIIELWELAGGADLAAPVVDPDSGLTIYPPTERAIVSKRRFYQANVAGRRVVRAMFDHCGAPDFLLVQFDDSRDLCRVDPRSGTTELLVSAQSEPLLARDYHDRVALAHPTFGFLYAFVAVERGRTKVALFSDPERNGVLSTTPRVLDEHGWDGLRLAGPPGAF